MRWRNFYLTCRWSTFFISASLLGAVVRALPDPNIFSSATKGESFEEAVCALTRVGGMEELRSADTIILRHTHEGMAERAAKVVNTALGDGNDKLPLPIINAGDGPGQHPTQAFVDLFTIYQERQTAGHPLDNITILFSGDLKFGRVTNSLLHLLGKFGEKHRITVIFSTLPQLGPKPDILEYLARHHITYRFIPRLVDAIPLANVLYLTRIQRERPGMESISCEERSRYVVQIEHLNLFQPGTFLMHPLPINRDPKEPPAEIDIAYYPLAAAGDPRVAYLRQSLRGVPVRTALLDLIWTGMDRWLAEHDFES